MAAVTTIQYQVAMDKTSCFISALNIVLVLVISCEMMMSCHAYANLATDQSSLLHFKAHITSDPYHMLTRNWSNSSSVCSWIGVTCGVRHHRVISLSLSGMGLVGTISPELGNLSFLTTLELRFNNFSGVLPFELSRLHRLKFFSVMFNKLVGEIPTWFGPRLERLLLANNSFSGHVPKQLSNFSNLQFLELSSNLLEGEIPEELGSLQNLQWLDMQGNTLSGGIPSAIFNMSSLKILSFRANELSGGLPNELCKYLPFLEGIYLGANKLSGHIPSNLSHCGTHLQVLGLAYNLFNGGIPAAVGELTNVQSISLGGNNFSGLIPKEIGNLQNLVELGLERNQISGGLPASIFNLSSLQNLILGQNQLAGNLPRDFRNLTSLRVVDLPSNLFTGALPREVGQLDYLSLAMNKLKGTIPVELFNISTLQTLSLAGNVLSGALPTNICGGSLRLEELLLGSNQLSGVIPDSLSNCSNLKNLDFSYNKFTDFQPHLFGNLPLLQRCHLFGNNLSIELSSFITSLTNCRSLNNLAIGDDPAVYGFIPASVGNLSSSLQIFAAYNCKIQGEVPPHIANLSNLVLLDLSDNELSGNIPPTVKLLYSLQGLLLHNNNIEGPIPKSLCGLNSLNIIQVTQNQLSGPIPACLGNLTSLRNLYLGSNKLSSNIPPSLWSLRDLLNLDLSSNYLSGPLPLQIGNLVAAISINLTNNQLNESIPSTIGNLQNLVNLSLAHNSLEGFVPTSLGSMIILESLDLSHNNLSGSIPKSLEKLLYLEYLNVSFNDLSGEIPTGGPFRNFTMESFKYNKALCGAPKFNVPPCPPVSHHGSKKKKVEFALFIVAGVVVLFAVVCLAIIFTRCRGKHNRAGGVDELTSVVRERISYYDILQATDRFNESNLLGLGSFGSVYRGILRDGETVAVKVFSLQPDAALRSFEVECEIMRNIRHRNLIKVISSCTNLDFRALVLEYMPKGNLDQWLYSHNYCLDVMQRLNIMIDVASALEYLHHDYSMPIVHCDLKPSNVLLDEDMVAHVSDFGIAKLFANEENNVITNTLATLGYIAPEYGMEGLVSTNCDVYSYGIMLMETFTRKRPSDDMFAGDLSLRSWIESSILETSDEVIDANLLSPGERNFEKKLECISSILELALRCAAESPRDRITMKEAAAKLHKIKHQFSS